MHFEVKLAKKKASHIGRATSSLANIISNIMVPEGKRNDSSCEILEMNKST